MSLTLNLSLLCLATIIVIMVVGGFFGLGPLLWGRPVYGMTIGIFSMAIAFWLVIKDQSRKSRS